MRNLGLWLIISMVGLTLQAETQIDAVLVNHATEAATIAPTLLAQDSHLAPIAMLTPAEIGAAEKFEAMQAWNAAGRTPMQAGFTRTIPLPESVHFSALLAKSESKGDYAKGRFKRSEDFVTWGTRLHVTEAHGLRLHLNKIDLPEGTQFWVYSPEGEIRPFGMELKRETNDLWTPVIFHSDILLEVRVPASSIGPTSGFQVAGIMELIAPENQNLSARGEKGGCLFDAMCFGNNDLDNINLLRQAVAHLQFVEDSITWICTGGLLNDTDTSSFIPYLNTANHCFSTQGVASTLAAFFDYHPNTCGGTPPSLNSLPQVNGSTLLATNSSTDSTLVQLANNPTGATGYLGWSEATTPTGTNLFRISHPNGLSQAWSTHRVHNPTGTCSGIPTSKYTYSEYTYAGIAGGSSGAVQVDDQLRAQGQLRGTCGLNPEDGCDTSNDQVDGRFSEFFDDIEDWLDPQQGACEQNDTTLCLNNNRFRVKVNWENFQGGVGQGQIIDLTSDSGLFWFFNANNVEMLVKVLDACTYNDRFWVFAAATTNVEYTLTVTDTQTSTQAVYTNPLGTAAPAITDTGAFVCP